MFDFDTYCTQKRKWFDAELLHRFVPALETKPEALHRAMHYSLFAPGKRIRPLLVFASAEALGLSPEDVLPIAACLEMIHVFSLIHDDLPCMDDDDWRRGQPTSHKIHGEALALLAGDALLTQAFLPLADLNVQRYSAPAVFAVWRAILQATGSLGMIGGQVLDLAAEGQTLTLAELRDLHARKTGALIAVSVVAPAILAQSQATHLASLQRFAECVGLAFQIVDDILDIEGENLGKDLQSDLANNKSTYPSLLGLEKARQESVRLLQEAETALSFFDSKAEALRALGRFVIARKS